MLMLAHHHLCTGAASTGSWEPLWEFSNSSVAWWRREHLYHKNQQMLKDWAFPSPEGSCWKSTDTTPTQAQSGVLRMPLPLICSVLRIPSLIAWSTSATHPAPQHSFPDERQYEYMQRHKNLNVFAHRNPPQLKGKIHQAVFDAPGHISVSGPDL